MPEIRDSKANDIINLDINMGGEAYKATLHGFIISYSASSGYRVKLPCENSDITYKNFKDIHQCIDFVLNFSPADVITYKGIIIYPVVSNSFWVFFLPKLTIGDKVLEFLPKNAYSLEEAFNMIDRCLERVAYTVSTVIHKKPLA